MNRHATDDLTAEVSLIGFGDLSVADHQVMTQDSLLATNTLVNMNNVVPRKGSGAMIDGGVLTLKLKPHSYTMIRLKTR